MGPRTGLEMQDMIRKVIGSQVLQGFAPCKGQTQSLKGFGWQMKGSEAGLRKCPQHMVFLF